MVGYIPSRQADNQPPANPNLLICPRCGLDCGMDHQYFRDHPCHPIQHYGREVPSMATVIICDRCGEVWQERAAGTASHQPNPNHPGEVFKLCAACSEALYHFMRPKGKDQRTIMHPFDPSEAEGTRELEGGASDHE